MRVVKYQRVSTTHQEVENQTDSIDRQIELLGWTIVGEYKEVISGTKSRDTRPQLRQLLEDSRKRKFDRVIVYSLDRLGRSVVDVINTIGMARLFRTYY
jgi:DNA invertase Pin-like site-specific DNA recombinase